MENSFKMLYTIIDIQKGFYVNAVTLYLFVCDSMEAFGKKINGKYSSALAVNISSRNYFELIPSHYRSLHYVLWSL